MEVNSFLLLNIPSSFFILRAQVLLLCEPDVYFEGSCVLFMIEVEVLAENVVDANIDVRPNA